MGYVQNQKPIVKSYSAADAVAFSNVVAQATTGQVFVKLKAIIVSEALANNSILRVKFSIHSSNGNAAHGRIYFNGVAKGTDQSTASTSDVVMSEDLTFPLLRAGDSLELWGYIVTTGTCTVSNFNVCGAAADFQTVI